MEVDKSIEIDLESTPTDLEDDYLREDILEIEIPEKDFEPSDQLHSIVPNNTEIVQTHSETKNNDES